MDNKEFNWDEAISLAHKTAVEHGFWDDTPNYEHLAMLVITELGEAIDADRYGRILEMRLEIIKSEKEREDKKDPIRSWFQNRLEPR